MANNQLRSLINKKLNAKEVLRKLGIKFKDSGEECVFNCVFHDDKNPSCSVNTKKNLFQCFGCRKAGDLIYLISHVRKISVDSVIEENVTLASFPKTLNDYEQYMKVTEEPIDPDEEYVEDLEFLIDTSYSLLKMYYDKMKRLPVFSDYEVKYHRLSTNIENLEYELSFCRVELFEKRHPPKVVS
jgi:hypothetical protein